ncbi:MAG: HGGxSTG domain-containing protein [Steroidobacteraceae bacterium]
MPGNPRWRSSANRSVNRFRSGAGIQMISKHLRNTGAMLSSPRCGARTRSGKPCRSPAVSGKRRCRMHGGAPGSGAPRGNKNALKHGNFTREAIAERRQLGELMLQSRELIQKINENRFR